MTAAVNTGPAVFATPNPGKGGMPFNLPTTKADTPDAINSFSTAFLAAITGINQGLDNARNNFGQPNTLGGYAHGYVPPALVNAIMQDPKLSGDNALGFGLANQTPATSYDVPGTGQIDPATGLTVTPVAAPTGFSANSGGQIDPRVIGKIITDEATANPKAVGTVPPPQKGGQGLWSRITAPLSWLANGVAGVVNSGAAVVEQSGWKGLVSNDWDKESAKYKAMPYQTQQEYLAALRSQHKSAQADYLEKDVNPNNPIASIAAGVSQKTAGFQETANDIARRQPGANATDSVGSQIFSGMMNQAFGVGPLSAAAGQIPAVNPTSISDVGAGVLGTGMSIGLDPLTYVGPKAITAIAGGFKKGAGLITGSTARTAAETAKGLNTPIGELAKTSTGAGATAATAAIDTGAAISKPVPTAVPAIAAKLTTTARVAEDTAAATPHLAQAGTDLIPPAPIAINLDHAKIIDGTVAKATKLGSYTDKGQAANLMTVASRARTEAKVAGIIEPAARQIAVGDKTIDLLRQVEDAHAAAGLKTATGLHMSDVLSATPELRSLANETFFTLNNTGQVARVMHSEQIMAGAQKALDVSTWVPTAGKAAGKPVTAGVARVFARKQMNEFIQTTSATVTQDAKLQSGIAKNLFNAVSKGTTVNARLLLNSNVAARTEAVATKMGLIVDNATGKVAYNLAGHPLMSVGRDITVPVSRSMQVSTIEDAVKAAVPGAKPLPAALVNKFANTMLDAAPALRAKTSIRIASTQAKDIADAAVIGNEAASRMTAIAENPLVSTADAVDEIVNAGKKIAQDAKARGMSTAAAQIAAVQSGTAAKAAGAVSGDLRAAEHMTGIVNDRAVLGAFADDKIAARTRAYAVKVFNETPDIIKSLDPKLLEYVSGGDMIYGAKMVVEQTNLLQRFLHPIGFKISKWAAGASGKAATARQLLVQARGAVYSHNIEFETALNEVAKLDKVNPGVVGKAWDMMQLKQVPTAVTDAAVREAYTALAPQYDYVLNLGRGSKSESLFGLAWRNGGSVEQVNRYLESVGISFKYDLKAAKGDYSVMADQIFSAKIKDPLDFLSRANKAFNTLATNQVVGATFSRNFGKSILEMTPNEAKTWVKITKPVDLPKLTKLQIAQGERVPKTLALDPKKLAFFDHIDKTRYYSPEAVAQMGNLERIAKQTNGLTHLDGSFGKIVNNLYDPFIQIWKSSVVMFRPGSHIKNYISDVMINMMDGVYTAQAYKDAAQVVRVGMGLSSDPTIKQIIKGTGKSAQDITGNLSRLRFGDLSGTDHLATATFARGGDAPKVYSYAEAYRAASDNGILSSFHATLDIQDSAGALKNPIANLADRIVESKAGKVAGKVSNISEYNTRLAQYIKNIRDPTFTRQFKTAADMEAAAAAKVRKFHPEVSGLNNFEQTYMRRLMPFYSWFRQTAPAILEAGLYHPGRVLMYNKVMYGASIATGGNPNTINDPFDVNTVYPSFIRDMESTAPLKIAGMDIGYDLGGPTESLAELANGNPVSNALSMSSPLVYAPLELLSGKQLRMDSGGPIGNTNDYFDRLIPGANDIAQITGYSPTGTVMNILSHTPNTPSQNTEGGWGPVFSRQEAVLTGNKNTFFNLNTLNFLTGLGIANYDQKNLKEAGIQELQTGIYR